MFCTVSHLRTVLFVKVGLNLASVFIHCLLFVLQEELKGPEFSSCEGDSKVFDGSLNTTLPCSVDIRFPNEELYTSTGKCSS